MSVQDLREMLRERAEGPAPAIPDRHELVRRRVRRTWRRRVLASAAATVAATVAAGAAVLSLLPGGAVTRHEPATSASAVAPAPEPLPERFTAHDGTGYRRLATATVRTDGARRTSVTIPVTGRPLDVAALCDGSFGATAPRISVAGRAAGASPPFSPCLKGMELVPLPVPAGAGQVTVTFDTTTRGGGCTRQETGAPCVTPEPVKAVWSLAVYEWTPPARPVDPEPLRAFPKRLPSWELAGATQDRIWPQDGTATVTVRGDGGRMGIEALCAGDLARRMWFTYRIGGGDEEVVTCSQWTGGPYPMAMTELSVPEGRRVTVTVRAGIWGEDANRPVRWALAVYRKRS
ncbi:hypothetical protein AB0C33_49415 [Nonomuraea sp. NPDC048881]|uniref:hypothetical protein n=1 Tax=Nonomuraea sp. NPDC048881 TaxID=3155030 RepID=UPI0033E8556A